MGGGLCSGDRYQTINQLYGDQIKKYIIKQKGKQFLDREITKLKKEVQEVSIRNQNQNLKIIKQSESQIQQYYKRTVEQLDKKQPGGIKSLQQMSNKTAEELLGYHYIMKLFEQLKESATITLRQQEQQIIQELTEIKMTQQNQLKQEEFGFIINGSVSENEKSVIRSRLQMDYHTQISQYESLLYDQYSQRLTMKNYDNRLLGMDCKQQLSNLVLIAKQKLKIGINLILGERIDSFIIIE